MTAPNPLHYGWWLASRASGVVALLMVTLSVVLGLLMAGRRMRRPGLKRTLRTLHEEAALAGLVSIAVHGITLLGDRWLHPGIAGISIPFALSYRPLYTAMGIIAAYLAALLGLSFYARRRIGGRLWRRLHRATILVWLLGVIHALGAGTDASAAWLRLLVLASALPVVVLFVARLRPPQRGPTPQAARSRAASARRSGAAGVRRPTAAERGA